MTSAQVQWQAVVYGPYLDNLRQHTELHYVGWVKIKTNWTQTDVITP